ncbi:MAG: hypothetical protein LBD96_10855 [Treponema sp.]|nr:hypothetical protein [Treponema sp.]
MCEGALRTTGYPAYNRLPCVQQTALPTIDKKFRTPYNTVNERLPRKPFVVLSVEQRRYLDEILNDKLCNKENESWQKDLTTVTARSS